MSRQNSRRNRITKLRDQKCGRKPNSVSPLRLSSMAFGGISMRTNNPPSSSFCLDRACYTSLVRGYTTSTKPSSIARTNPRSISPPLSSSLFQNIYESTVNIIAIPYRMFSRFTKEEEGMLLFIPLLQSDNMYLCILIIYLYTTILALLPPSMINIHHSLVFIILIIMINSIA